MKTCNTCKEVKPLEDFVKDSANKDGHKGICKKCWMAKYYSTEKSRESMKKWRDANPLKRVLRRRQNRILAISSLGGKCACCGETRLEFLAIDHIVPIKRKRQNLSDKDKESGDNLVNLVLRDGSPKDKFRVLCHNCNSSYGWYGYCPHKEQKDFLSR